LSSLGVQFGNFVITFIYSSNLGSFWLKIKQLWPFEEIFIFSNGGHLGWRAWLSDIILEGIKNRKMWG
jgi:Na+-transporting NADH:ubiquinone oxidoreductase subunit NqrE